MYSCCDNERLRRPSILRVGMTLDILLIAHPNELCALGRFLSVYHWCLVCHYTNSMAWNAVNHAIGL